MLHRILPGQSILAPSSADSCLLAVENLKYGQEPGDGQDLTNLGSQIQEFQLPSLSVNGGEGAYQLTNARAVDVIYPCQVDDDLFHSVVQKVLDCVANSHGSLAKNDLAADIQNVSVANDARMNVHVSLPDSITSFRATAPCTIRDAISCRARGQTDLLQDQYRPGAGCRTVAGLQVTEPLIANGYIHHLRQMRKQY